MKFDRAAWARVKKIAWISARFSIYQMKEWSSDVVAMIWHALSSACSRASMSSQLSLTSELTRSTQNHAFTFCVCFFRTFKSSLFTFTLSRVYCTRHFFFFISTMTKNYEYFNKYVTTHLPQSASAYTSYIFLMLCEGVKGFFQGEYKHSISSVTIYCCVCKRELDGE